MSAEELSFVRATLDRLTSQPVTYDDAFTTPAADRPRKPRLVEIEVADPPTEPSLSSSAQPGAASSSSTITLSIKCLKPALTLALPGCSPLDPISAVKDALHRARPDIIPPASHQRLLVKGKALADGVLLREYALGEGSQVVLMLKPGYVRPASSQDGSPAAAAVGGGTSASDRGIPTEPAPSDPTSPSAVPTLTLSDPSSPSMSSALPPSAFTSPTALPPTEAHYHSIIADPAFWTALDAFLKARFGEVADAERFFELALLGQKRYLKEGEVAKIRDETGITAMGGGLP